LELVGTKAIEGTLEVREIERKCRGDRQTAEVDATLFELFPSNYKEAATSTKARSEEFRYLLQGLIVVVVAVAYDGKPSAQVSAKGSRVYMPNYPLYWNKCTRFDGVQVCGTGDCVQIW